MNETEFATAFEALTDNRPFPWLWALYQRFINGEFPPCNIPTGLGKTSVIHVWLLALAHAPTHVPRRLAYVVNRRTVVDQSTDETIKLRKRLDKVPGLTERLRNLCSDPDPNGIPLAISTLRGQFADNREWSSDPARPAVIAGTVDMIGSRLLFNGYGCGFKSRPLHAGFLGQDVLLVHDEAHLEPAFQKLITAIEREQRSGRTPDYRPLRVMELTATSRADREPQSDAERPCELTSKDLENEIVNQRIQAKKGITFHPVKFEKGATAAKIGDLAAAYKNNDSQQAILVFVRTIDDVNVVAKKIAATKASYELLTGTIRGKERDELVRKPLFRRFRPGEQEGAEAGTVFLICTSAGEVGIDISADNLVCDLVPLDSMAQRFGRVNRRGGHEKKAHIDLVYEKDGDPKKKDDPFEKARWATLKVLRDRLLACDWDAARQNASPESLGKMMAELSDEQRKRAFTPEPTILETSDILFDSWALTSVREPLPGRPPVAEYLHGVESELPETYVAWRQEVELLCNSGLTDKDFGELLEDYPLKPHELLRDRSDRVLKHLAGLAQERGGEPVWLVDNYGNVETATLSELVEDKERINYRTVVLPPSVGGLTRSGILGSGDQTEHLDIADDWLDEDRRRRRVRIWDEESIPDDVGPVRLIRTIDTKRESEEQDAETETAGRRYWKWYVRPRSADQGGGPSATKEQLLVPHLADAERAALAIVEKLLTDPALRTAVRLAAKWHDLGKRRALWQSNMGNTHYPAKVIAKTGHNKPPKEWISYRHEFGSLLDVQDEKQAFFKDFAAESENVRELILHLIATHHGRGRPHYPADEAVDPEHREIRAAEIAREVPRRYARLQRKYGRWGLAWLESLLRAADAEASAKPNEVLHA
jgi:CRISPR-associated endonuclease/helicase Cas3